MIESGFPIPTGFHLRSVPTRSKLVDNDAIGRAFDRLRPQDRLILVGLVPLVVAGVVVAARRWPS
jgi:hypothetical protein